MIEYGLGNGGLKHLLINSKSATAEIYCQGAHLIRWQPKSCPHPVFWISKKSLFEPGKPIRGGSPICFPKVGLAQGNAKYPMHGPVRFEEWNSVPPAPQNDDTVQVGFKLASNQRTLAVWSHKFELETCFVINPELKRVVTIRNTGDAPFSCEILLHDYFAIGNLRRARIFGLKDSLYFNKPTGEIFSEGNEWVSIAGETDRVYSSDGPVILDDPGFRRRINIEKTNSKSTAVWNPWVEKSKAMPDFGDDEYLEMICVESGNALNGAITVEPGKEFTMSVVVRVEMY